MRDKHAKYEPIETIESANFKNDKITKGLTICLFLINIILALTSAIFQSKELTMVFFTIFLILLAFFILWLSKSILGYIKQVTELTRETRQYIDYADHNHITIQRQIKEVEISDDTITKGICKITSTIQIYNHEENTEYDEYLYSVGSSEDTANINDIYFSIDDSPESNVNQNNYKKIIEEIYDNNTKKKEKYYRIEIPIHVGVGGCSSKKLKVIEYNCPSYSIFKNLSEDYFSLDSLTANIVYPTRRLEIRIKLNLSSNAYNLIIGENKGDVHSCSKGFKVLNYSNQFVQTHKSELIQWNAIPQISTDKQSILWIVDEPKMGYRYRIIFGVENSNKK